MLLIFIILHVTYKDSYLRSDVVDQFSEGSPVKQELKNFVSEIVANT